MNKEAVLALIDVVKSYVSNSDSKEKKGGEKDEDEDFGMVSEHCGCRRVYNSDKECGLRVYIRIAAGRSSYIQNMFALEHLYKIDLSKCMSYEELMCIVGFDINLDHKVRWERGWSELCKKKLYYKQAGGSVRTVIRWTVLELIRRRKQCR